MTFTVSSKKIINKSANSDSTLLTAVHFFSLLTFYFKNCAVEVENLNLKKCTKVLESCCPAAAVAHFVPAYLPPRSNSWEYNSCFLFPFFRFCCIFCEGYTHPCQQQQSPVYDVYSYARINFVSFFYTNDMQLKMGRYRKNKEGF